MLEAARLEGVPQLPVDARVLAEDDAREQAAALPRGPTGERRLHVRAQPVADATDPAPPADDAPAVVAAQHHVHAATREPAALVEAGLGPTRRDRPRAQLEHGALRRRPLRRKLEQHPLADAGRAEPHAPRPACGRRTASGRQGPVTTTRADAGRAEPLGEDAPLERVVPQRPPPEPRRARGPPRRARACAGRVTRERRRARSRRHPRRATGGGRTQVEAAMPDARRPRRAARASRSRAAARPVPVVRSRRRSRGRPHGVTRSRSCSMRAGPIPGTSSRSSTDRNGPCVVRQSTIFCAVTGPIPGSSSSCSTVAVARLTFAPGAGRARERRRHAVRAAARHDHLLTVDERRGEVHRREVGARASGRRRARPHPRRACPPSDGTGPDGGRRRRRGRTASGPRPSPRPSRPRRHRRAGLPERAPHSRRRRRAATPRRRAAPGAARRPSRAARA